jgi:hypothetical protein
MYRRNRKIVKQRLTDEYAILKKYDTGIGHPDSNNCRLVAGNEQ